MIMNKPIIRYILVFVGIGALLFFLLKGRTPFGKNNTSFAVNTDVEITRIDFFQGNKKLSLEKSEDKWLVNKKEEARKNAVLFVLRTLREIRIKSPVSSELFDNEIVIKKIEPVKVNVYEKRKIVKSFFIYKTGSNIYGNIMKMRVSSKPFIVFIPGFEGNIGTHFITNELFWKSYLVFNLLPSQISSLKVENISDTSSSFIIDCKKPVALHSDIDRNMLGWDSLKVKRYLSYYTAVSLESWALDLTEAEKKEIESGIPLFRISLKQMNGKEIVLTIWEKWNFADGKKTKDTDSIWAKTNLCDDIFIMRYFDLDPILKKISYFLAK